MAKDSQTLERLYIELGLDLSKLQADILAADRTVTENLGRLNRERNIIRLRMEADISSLDSVKDATKILEIRETALNQQLAVQRDRMNILEAAYRQVANNANSTASAVNKAEQAFLREKIAVGQLERELRNLSAQKTTTPINNLLSGYQNIKGSVTGTLQEIINAFNQLQGATSSADSALTATLGIIGSIPHPVGKAVAALASIPIVIKGIENSFLDLAKASAKSGDLVYVTSRYFQMSFEDTAKFVAMCNIAGSEVNEVATAVRRAQQQIVKGGDESRAAEELRRYGEAAYDAGGHLKNLNDMVLTFNRALKKAQAEGREAEFILRTFRTASGDVIATLEDAEGNYEAAEKIIRGGLFNPALAHTVQGLINELNTQTDLVSSNLATAFLPAAEEFVPKLTERMKILAQAIADNKDVIKEFGHDAGEIFLSMERGAEEVISAFGTIIKAAYDLKKRPTLSDFFNDRSERDSLIDRFKEDLDIGSVDDLIKKAQPKAYDVIKNDPRLYAQVKAQYQPIYQALVDVQAEIKAKQEEVDETVITTLSGEALKYQSELKAIIDKVNLNDYQKKVYDIRAWEESLLQESEKTESEKLIIKDLANAKIVQADQELADKLKGIRESVASADKTALQQNLAAIEKEKESWLKAGMEESEAVRLAQKKIADAYAETAKKAQEHWKNAASIQYELTHSAFEKELHDIDLWKDAQLEKAEVAEEVQSIIAESAAKESQAFEREVDRIKGKMQTLDDKIFEIDHSRYESDLRKIQQEYLNQAQEYQQAGILPLFQDKLDYLYRRQKEELDKRASKDRDYRKSPTDNGMMQRGNNGIMVIEGDRITDDGLIRNRKEEIDLLTDENRIRLQLLANLSDSERQLIETQQSLKSFVDVPNFQPAVQIQQPPVDSLENSLQGTQPKIELRDVISPLTNIEGTVQSILREMQSSDKYSLLSPLSSIQDSDKSTLLQPLTNINFTVQNILQEMKTKEVHTEIQRLVRGQPHFEVGKPSDSLTNLLPSLSSIDVSVQSILQEMQSRETKTSLTESPTTEISVSTLAAPLNRISAAVEQILVSMKDRTQNLSVAPNMNISLGGAYVFDEQMKGTLVNDITNNIVNAITETVQQATSRPNYSYSI